MSLWLSLDFILGSINTHVYIHLYICIYIYISGIKYAESTTYFYFYYTRCEIIINSKTMIWNVLSLKIKTQNKNVPLFWAFVYYVLRVRRNSTNLLKVIVCFTCVSLHHPSHLVSSSHNNIGNTVFTEYLYGFRTLR